MLTLWKKMEMGWLSHLIINLINIGLSSFNHRTQIPNDMDINKKYIPEENLETAPHKKNYSWTIDQKMKLNKNKTNNMVFNFTDKYQFNTQLTVDGEKIYTVNQTKLIGTTITNNLKWGKKNKRIDKESKHENVFTEKVSTFKPPMQDIRLIYIQYFRSMLEQSCVIWHSSLTMEQREDIERIKKIHVK